MNDQTKTFAQAMQTAMAEATTAALSPESSTGPSKAFEKTHKLAFLETFQRWERLFARRDKGDAASEMWLVSEYYQSLSFLTADGFNALTDELKRECTFFPTIRECLAITKPSRWNYSRTFGGHPDQLKTLIRTAPPTLALNAPRAALTHDAA